MREKLCVLRVITSIIYDRNNNNVFQASTSSSEEITKIKIVFLNSKTWNVELSAFAKKKRLLELSAFAIKQTYNMLKKHS